MCEDQKPIPILPLPNVIYSIGPRNNKGIKKLDDTSQKMVQETETTETDPTRRQTEPG